MTPVLTFQWRRQKRDQWPIHCIDWHDNYLFWRHCMCITESWPTKSMLKVEYFKRRPSRLLQTSLVDHKIYFVRFKTSMFIISKITAPANLCEVSRVDAHSEVDSHEGGGQKNFYLETLLSWYSITKGITTMTMIMRMINVILPVLLSVIPTIFLAINM